MNHSLALPAVQSLKTVVLCILSSFIVESGEGLSPTPGTP